MKRLYAIALHWMPAAPHLLIAGLTAAGVLKATLIPPHWMPTLYAVFSTVCIGGYVTGSLFWRGVIPDSEKPR